MKPDEIRIIGIEMAVHIGVPDEERAAPQTVEADVTLRMIRRCEGLDDEIARAIDYQAVTERLRATATARPRRLIETLAADLADCALREFDAESVVVEIRKRILPQVDHCAVRIERHA